MGKQDVTNSLEIKNTSYGQMNLSSYIWLGLDEHDFGISELKFLKNQKVCDDKVYSTVCDSDVPMRPPLLTGIKCLRTCR